MSTQDVMVPPLNQTQALAILEEAKNRGMMEGPIPADPAVQQQSASQLVAHAKLAFDNGNKGDAVMAVLFNAEVDMNPSVPVPPPAAAAAPPPGAPVAPPPGAPPTPQAAAPAPAPAGSSFDLPTMSTETIEGMIAALQNPQYANQPNVQQELAVLQGELANRQAAGGQPVAQAPQAQAVAPPAPPPPAAAPPQPPVPSAVPPAAPGVPVPPGAPDPTAAGSAPQPGIGQPVPDAPAVPGPEAPAAPGEGDPTAATAVEEAAERAQLESGLTLASLQAYGVDPAAVPTLSMETLRGIVANPAGPMATDTTATAPVEATPTSDQREALIAQITGPILKAWGRGRKELPEIGEQELALMVTLPDGNVTMDQLNGARLADGVTSVVLPPALKQQAAPAAPLTPPPGTPGAPPAPAPVAAPTPPAAPPAPVAPVPAAPPSAFAPPPVEAPAAPQPPVPVAAPPAPAPAAPPQPPAPVAAAPAPPAPAPAPVAPPTAAPPMPAVGEGSQRAMQIIEQENFPIPPEIEGDPPRLPNDLSKVSDEELQSYHARFHACEARANWVISKFDTDEIGPVKKLLRDRRREVAASLPSVDENNKKLTKDAKEVLIEQDAGVQQYLTQLEEIEATMGKLKVLRDNYHQDVSTCSRQWSMRSGEAEKQPGAR